jgi:RNA polymerase sigma-70 factor (ECF subfamily)
LKSDHRSAIELAFFEDLSYREISEIADVPEGTVKTRVFHAKQLLMRCLAGRIGKEAL